METGGQKGTEKRERVEPRFRTSYVSLVTTDCFGSSSLTWMRRAMALYQVPKAVFNKDRIWHRAHDRTNDLAGLVLTHCHRP